MRSSTAAVTSPSPSTPGRHLRIGIIEGKQIVEERIVRAPKTVTIGSSPDNTFITSSESWPRQWRLFEARRGRLILRLGPGMTARIAAGSTVSMLEAAPESEAVRPVVLTDGARGKVSLGETTVLFQRVRPSAPRPRPQLPVSVRRRVLGELDGSFAAILAATLLLHVAVVVYLRQVDWPRRPSLDELPDRFVRQMLLRPRPAPIVPAPVVPTTADRSKSPSVHASRVAAAPSPRPAASAGERRAVIEKQVRQLGLLKVIGALGDGGSAPADLLAAGGVDRPVEEALKGIGGLAVAQDESLRNLPRVTDGGGKVATAGDLRGLAGIAAATDLGPVGERGVKANLRVDTPSVEGGRVDPEAIAREVRGRRRAVAACYERALKQRPTLAGKLVVRFSLSTAGTISAVEIDEDTLAAPEVAACVRALILRWRFPTLPDGPAELSFPFLFQPGS